MPRVWPRRRRCATAYDVRKDDYVQLTKRLSTRSFGRDLLVFEQTVQDKAGQNRGIPLYAMLYVTRTFSVVNSQMMLYNVGPESEATHAQ